MALNWSTLLTNINKLSDITAILTKILATLDTKANLSDLDGLGVDAISKSQIGVANGVAPLGNDVKVPSAYLPSYVDEITEYSSLSAFPLLGESGKIYVAIDTEKIYRWSGSMYIEVSPSPGTTDAVLEGAINKYYTDSRAKAAVLTETVANVSNPSLVYASGTIQVLTLTANGTLTCDLTSGQKIALYVPPTPYTLDISGFINGNGFTGISATKLSTIVLNCVGTTKYIYGVSN